MIISILTGNIVFVSFKSFDSLESFKTNIYKVKNLTWSMNFKKFVGPSRKKVHVRNFSDSDMD